MSLFLRKLPARNPVINEVMMPMMKFVSSWPAMPVCVNSDSKPQVPAAAITGIPRTNEVFTELSKFCLSDFEVRIVMPERETPGMKAKICDAPIINEVFSSGRENVFAGMFALEPVKNKKIVPRIINANAVM